MSIKLMSAAWELDIPSTEKMVLLCLCDFAGDDGSCWPSVPTIARKCSKGDRTVQAAIQWLRNEGYCSWDETPGKPHRFALSPRKICATQEAPNPRKSRTPANLAPPQDLQLTPAELADEPLREPSVSSEAKASSPRAWSLPVGVSLQVWQDFKRNRERKRLPNTETAWKAFNEDLARVSSQTGIPPPKLIEHAAAKGWGSINDPNGRTNGIPKQASLSSVVGRILSDGGFDRGTRQDAGLGSANVDERGTARALAPRGG